MINSDNKDCFLEQLFKNGEWKIIDKFATTFKEPQYFQYDSLNLHNLTKQTLLNKYPDGIYQHQKKAIQYFLNNKNICLTTSTSSGKSLVFHVCALETLLKRRESKIIAIYPMKALAQEQLEKFINFFPDIKIDKIDGSIPVYERLNIIEKSDIIIFTPDVIHAWLLNNLENETIVKFLVNLELIIIDEAHLYSGVFGSNSAYLYRRLNHVIYLLKKHIPNYITASATIANPKKHMKKLTGLEFEIITQEDDTSGSFSNTFYLVEGKDFLKSLSDLFAYIIKNSDKNFIAFVDSRKQTEQVATISSRNLLEREMNEDEELEEIIKDDNLIVPYRAGYEEDDRTIIQRKLNKGELRGVVSTSALEVGIDIPYLDIAILLGVPESATSFYQRIGRVGRQKPGIVIIVKDHKPITHAVFDKKIDIFNLPLQESAIYLENPRIEYIHVLCLASEHGEHEQICQYLNINEKIYNTKIDFPKSFLELCQSEISGELSAEFQLLKAQSANDPHHYYPLRDNDIQYKIVYKQGPNMNSLGSLSFSQVMREAYPGAVYYYMKTPYRVYNINTYAREIEVRKEKYYHTKPIVIDPKIRPNFSNSSILQGVEFGELLIIETNMQISELIAGYTETRGSNSFTFPYPLNGNIYFQKKFFARNYFTTGVVFISDKFSEFSKDELFLINNFIYNGFQMAYPFERRDLDFGIDKSKVEKQFIKEDENFMTVFDVSYGSLRISSNIMKKEILENTFDYALFLAKEFKKDNQEDISSIIKILKNIIYLNNYKKLTFSDDDTLEQYFDEQSTENIVKVLKPGSKAMNIKLNNEIFLVKDVVFTPKGLFYKGKYPNKTSWKEEKTIHSVPIENLVPIPGESEFGLYNIMEAEFI